MTTIGHLTQNTDGTLRGALRSAHRSVALKLEPNQQKDSEKSPDYRVLGVTDDGEFYELGGGWKKTHDGRGYISLNLDDPDWKSALSCAAFPVKGKADQFDVIWNRA